MFFLVFYKESVIKNRNGTSDNRSIYCSFNIIYILNRKCNMLYINNCSCISYIIANPFSIKGKPQIILQLTLSIFKSKLHCRCITIIQYISFGLKL